MSGCISRRQVLLAAAGAALGLCGCAAARQEEAASGPELILRYAENQPEDYPTTQAALAFADLVNERTGGRVKVAVYSGGELGAEQSVIQQMQFGGIDFARISLSQLAEYVPALSVLQLPYLYEDAAQMWRVLIGTIGDEFLAMLDAVDLVGLSWFDAGVRSFYTREKVTRLADLQGLTLRVQESDMMSDMVEAMGAVSVQVVYSDVYAALHNRKIDGAENNWPSYEAMSHYEVAPYFLQDEHTRVPEIQISSRAAQEKLAALDASFPAIVQECARESAQLERRLWAQREAQAEADLRAWGVEVTLLSDAEKQKFRDAVQPLYDQFSASESRHEISILESKSLVEFAKDLDFCLFIFHRDYLHILSKNRTFFETPCESKKILLKCEQLMKALQTCATCSVPRKIFRRINL